MIRYSSYGTTNFSRRSPALEDCDPLRAAYDELLKLRERVAIAEAKAAKQSHDGWKANRSKMAVKPVGQNGSGLV
jgi:hypothetical protein